jgi:gas vesicle protein
VAQDPQTIRNEIEQTRDRITDTVDAIGYKADVPSRVRENVAEKKDAVVDRVSRAKDAVVGKASEGKDAVAGRADQLTSSVNEKAPEPGEVKRRAVSVAQENPLGLAIGAAAVGFLAGMIVPTTPVEDEKLGPISDQVKRTAAETGQEALERGKQVAQEAASSALETAKQRGKQEADELKSHASDNASEAASSVRPGT